MWTISVDGMRGAFGYFPNRDDARRRARWVQRHNPGRRYRAAMEK